MNELSEERKRSNEEDNKKIREMSKEEVEAIIRDNPYVKRTPKLGS